ncbi:transcription factor HHO6 isoform X2 [Lolium perenne]|uniref:transcription factor HHO6 isoform X2 n=2 Tax=Lolium perenne TaxID=4522 RepID=UPI0021F6625B|nr:transcription factor HHO6-like isoform X4 [Lolium perenne]XP_051184744.1 transcription factor HHO6-like isoform X5 [Lolium perenne]XP_051184745.1 transcription factor HHO6-like isoform X6 [Lolium perenne]XP_051184746.1 transcription factor HHO6-like isoform X7 [Lolium perenne]
MVPSSAVSKDCGGTGEDQHQGMRAMAARTATDSLRAAVARSGAAEKAARLEECARSLEAEKAKMEVFRRELPISVHLIADVIEWLKDEVAQYRKRPAPDQLLAAAPSPSPSAKRKAEGVKTEADATDKRSWMSSAQLWTCGSHSTASTSTSNGGSDRKQAQKVSSAFMPLNGMPVFAKSSEVPEAATMAVPDLSLSSPAIDVPGPAAPSANSSAVTDAGEQQRQQSRKARRCWSPELHRRFVAALQRLGGPHVATPKQIRDMMKVDGLTNDEVKSHLQKYRLHTRRTSDGHRQQQSASVWPPPEQYTTSQHSTSQSGSPQGPLRLMTTGSSRDVSATAGDSCDGGEEEEEDGKSASYSWEVQQTGTKAASSS